MSAISYILAIATILIVPTSAFTTSHKKTARTSSSTAFRMVSREEYLKPHFHTTVRPTTSMLNFDHPASTTMTKSVPSSSSSSSVEQRVHDYCENKGGCDLEEMALLLEDFEQVNHAASSSLFSFDTTQTELRPQEEKGAPVKRKVDLEQHLRRMHEIADMEEH
ncbi:unnamed protein product [Cylindrotheca closterium]|uniref:Uncharacterized protein n=1 Tax=Cylindrotheca closterium TaxID=2856 RepID=A0AAD2CNU5_9STRA|nr:unnamed protein product [Cylindrotheca closterium]